MELINHPHLSRAAKADATPGLSPRTLECTCPINLAFLQHAPGGGLAPRLRLGCLLVFLLARVVSLADETNLPAAAPMAWMQETNAQEILRGILGLSDQLRSNQLATEQNGKEAREAAARTSELFSNSLRNLEETITSRQQAFSERTSRELREMQSANRVVVTIVGLFTAAVALTLLLIAYFQWRISKAWTHMTQLLPVSSSFSDKALGPHRSGASDPPGLAEASNAGLLHAVEELENRVQGLEHSSAAGAGVRGPASSSSGNGARSWANMASTAGPEPRGGPTQAKIVAWLSQGQSLLKQNDWEGALQCFDEVLALEPNHSEALVKKGAALERMKKLNEAFECYDRAIAADQSMTVAYLYKGGLCSRLERFKEALECYDKALRTHTD